MKARLALLATLPLLAVGSGAIASPVSPARNGWIAASGPEGVYVVDPAARTVQVIPKSADLADPEWSPDGTLLAVTSWRSAVPDVYTMKPDGSERSLVVRNASQPSWSPDGKQLVVVRDACPARSTCDSGASQLAVVSVGGAQDRPFELASESSISSPEWSPDGKSIAYIGSKGVMIVRLDGDESQRVDPEEAVTISWSPDSSKLAFDRYGDAGGGWRQDVVVLDLASGGKTVLAGEQRGASAPVWSPQGDQLAFISMPPDARRSATCGKNDPAQLWVMAPDGTMSHQVVQGSFYGPPSWARAADSPPVVAPPNPTATPRPSTATPAAPALVSGQPPAKDPAPTEQAESSSDSKGLIAVRGEDGIWLVDPTTAKARKVPGTAGMYAPAWSPDGSLLAVEQAQKAGGSSVYTIWPNGSHPQLVLPNASSPSWSADGNRIFASRSECSTACDPEDDDANVLYAVNLDGRNVQHVDYEDADVYNSRALSWPTDGSAIHFFDEESLTGPGSFDSSAAIWSPDGTQLVFAGSPGPADETSDRKAGLWIVSADGGKPRLLLSGASGRPSWVASQAN